jgi:HAD superfamily hydrolase (TIGR01662 family)
MTAKRWVCLDVGETLIDETRIWSAWADELGVPRLTFLAALGAVIARGDEHQAVFAMFGFDDWPLRVASVEQAHGGLQAQDLYPDALRGIEALKADGYRVAIVANQPAIRAEQLRSIGVEVDVLEMSEALGVAKPHPDFFDRVIELLGSPEPADVAYVGDRVDNDVLPAMAAGMRAVWLRRGPWGIIQDLPDGAGPALTVGTLDELVERICDAWVS